MSVRPILVLAVLGLAARSAFAEGTAERVRHALDVELPQRFAHADSNHDGRLTRAEALGAMPRVYAHFDQIDTAGLGYVTEKQIRDAVESQVVPRLSESGK